MKPWTSWLAQVGLAGSCLIWVGCGGSNAPDADAQPVTSAAPSSSTPEEPVASADSSPATAAEPAVASTSATPAGDTEATEAAPATRPEAPSATNEMLALANGGPAASGTGATSTNPAGNGAGAPGSSSNANPGMATSAMPTSAMPGSSAAGPAASGPGGEMASSGLGGDTGVSLSPDIAANINETPVEGVSSRNGSLNPTVFKSPWTAANAFLVALQKKNPDWLAQTTALRATTEASPKYQKVFTAILEQSLAPEDLDELAKKFEGMKVMGNNTPKSTGKFEIIVGKMASNGSQFHRTITLRKEKLGWKVCDISGAREFEKPIIMPSMRGGGMGGHHR